MAVNGYVLIQTEVGQAANVAARIREIDGVQVADNVTGRYDVVACVEADTIDQLGQMVVSKIQMVEGITSTLTCPVIHL